MMMIVLVGSVRPAKVEGVREALQAIAAIDPRFADAEVRAVAVDDVAPRMPMTEREILDGARARAEALRARAPQPAGASWFAVGVEGGLDPLPEETGRPGGLTLKSWACVTDGVRWSVGAGGAVMLPEHIARAVIAGEELGDVVDRFAGGGVRGTRGAWGVLTRDLVGRRDAFRLAVIAAFAPFYNAELYRMGSGGWG